jgi:GLPGLI family protein
MRYFILCFLLFFFLIGFSQNQSGKLRYHLEFNKSYLSHLNRQIDKNNESKSILIKYLDLIKSIDKQIFFTLLFCESESYFNKDLFLYPKESKMLSALVNYYNEGQYYIDNSSFNILKFERVFDKDYVISLPSQKWEIFDKEVITIMGYSCYKARTFVLARNGKDLDTVAAWFAPALNIPVAPNGFIGLPGAVLKLDLRLYSLVATGIVFEDCALPDIKIPKKIWTLDAFLKEVNEINRRLRN